MKQKTAWMVIAGLIFTQILGLFIFSRMIKQKASLLSEKKHQLTAFEQKENSLWQLQQDYGRLSQDLDILDQALPAKEKIIDFITGLENQASASGILVKINFSSQDVVSEGDFKSIAFALETDATYFQMVEYLKKIEQMPQVITTSQIQIQSPGGIEMANKVKLLMKLYLDPGGLK